MKILLILCCFSILVISSSNLKFSDNENCYKKDLSEYMKKINDGIIIQKINSLRPRGPTHKV